jgi:hypothetical protein
VHKSDVRLEYDESLASVMLSLTIQHTAAVASQGPEVAGVVLGRLLCIELTRDRAQPAVVDSCGYQLLSGI